MKTETLSILEKVKNGELTPQVAQEQLFVLFGVSGSVFTIDDMKKAFNAGARNGSRAGMRVARGGDLNMEHFDDWFPKHYR